MQGNEKLEDPRLMILHRRRLKPEGPGVHLKNPRILLAPSTSKKEAPLERGFKKEGRRLPQGLEAPVGDVQIRLVHLGSLRLRPKKKGGDGGGLWLIRCFGAEGP